jgi:YggT family protein
MTGSSLNAALFLVGLLFDFYVVVLIIRLVLAFVHADLYHPITQFAFKLTNPLVNPLKRFLPDLRGFETSTLVVILIVEALRFFFIIMASFGVPNFIGLFIIAFGDALRLTLQTLTLAIILQALISWINPNSPVYQVLYKFTSPVTRPFQRILPPIAGIDISPILTIIILQLLVIVMVNPIKGLGWGMAIGT